MKISFFTTCGDPAKRQDIFAESLACYADVADEIVVVDGSESPDTLAPHDGLWTKRVYSPWPDEFKFELIGQQFQRGYDACTGDWAVRMDLDFLLHEGDLAALRDKLGKHPDAPALFFPKRQFILADRYNVKSKLVLAYNKGKFGDRIRTDAGADLCQGSLDGVELTSPLTPVAVPVYNYDFMLKGEAVVAKDVARFARAWTRQFGNKHLGPGDEAGTFDQFLRAQLGRLRKPHRVIPFEAHPKYMRETVRRLRPNQFGHSVWGRVAPASYYA